MINNRNNLSRTKFRILSSPTVVLCSPFGIVNIPLLLCLSFLTTETAFEVKLEKNSVYWILWIENCLRY